MRVARRSASGKEVALAYEERDGKVSAAAFSGDFFSFPDEGVALLAKSLVGLPSRSLHDEGKEAVRARAEEMGLVLVGITMDDIVALLEAAR
jgi:hypothetical protein